MTKKVDVLKRREVTETHVYLYGGETIGDLVENYGEHCYLDIVISYDSAEVLLKEIRLETDEEYSERLMAMKQEQLKEAAEKRDGRKKKLADEKKEYERLKAKFEKQANK